MSGRPIRAPRPPATYGVKRAQGDWIAFLDADDQWTPEKTEEQLTALRKQPELHLIASDMTEMDAKGDTINTSVLSKHQLLERFIELGGKPLPNALAALLSKNFIPTGTVMVRRKTLISAGLFNHSIRFGEDLELWAKIASHHPITCLPRVHMLRRLHGRNATTSTLPVLTDLVKVKRSLRETAGITLKNQGLNADKLVADALWELGYWHFSQGNFISARRAFSESLKENLSKRALAYRLACSLPAGVTRRLRQAKQTLIG